MAEWTGEPGVDGVFSDFVDQRFDMDNKKYGRTSPVLDEAGDVMLEPGETLLHTAVASGISEYFNHGPVKDEGYTIEWAQWTPVTIAVTTSRLYFVSANLPINAVQRAVLKRYGTRHAGHIRWAWVEGLVAGESHVVLGMAANPEAKVQYVRDTPIAPCYRTFLRIELDGEAATISPPDLRTLAGRALVADRKRWPHLPATYREMLEDGVDHWARGDSFRHSLPGVLPYPLRSRAEFNHPDVCAARRDGAGLTASRRHLDPPLRSVPITPAEHRRLAKAIAKAIADGKPPGILHRFGTDMGRDYLHRLGTDPSTPRDHLLVVWELAPDLRDALRSHPNLADELPPEPGLDDHPGSDAIAHEDRIDAASVEAVCGTRFPERRPAPPRVYAAVAEELRLCGLTGISELESLIEQHTAAALATERDSPPVDRETKSPTTYGAGAFLRVVLRTSMGLGPTQYATYVTYEDPRPEPSGTAEHQETSESAAAGWFPDPWGEHRLRYHDGREWTGHVTD